MTPVILLTRPAPDSAAFAGALRARLPEARVVISPLLRIEWLGPLPDGAFDGLIFTSRNGVRAYLALGGPLLPCYCVGPGTADEARAAGFRAAEATGDARSLEALIRADRPAGRWLHAHGRHVRVALAERLSDAGIAVTGCAIYDQVAQELDAPARAALAGPAPVIAPVFSPRSAKLLSQGENPRAPVYIVAMSAAVREALGDWPHANCMIAGRMDTGAMLDATLESAALATRVEGGRTPK